MDPKPDHFLDHSQDHATNSLFLTVTIKLKTFRLCDFFVGYLFHISNMDTLLNPPDN